MLESNLFPWLIEINAQCFLSLNIISFGKWDKTHRRETSQCSHFFCMANPPQDSSWRSFAFSVGPVQLPTSSYSKGSPQALKQSSWRSQSCSGPVLCLTVTHSPDLSFPLGFRKPSIGKLLIEHYQHRLSTAGGNILITVHSFIHSLNDTY